MNSSATFDRGRVLTPARSSCVPAPDLRAVCAAAVALGRASAASGSSDAPSTANRNGAGDIAPEPTLHAKPDPADATGAVRDDAGTAMGSDHPEYDAWDALVRRAFRRTWRARLRVTDGPGRRRQAALWGLVHVLWAATDLRDLGFEVPIDDLVDLMRSFRRAAGFAAKPRTRRRYFDDNAWLGLVALALPEPELARELLAFVQTGEDPSGGILWVEGGTSRNTCSTASAAWLACSLGEDAFALHTMGWLNATLRGPSGLYADHIDGERIDPTVYSYNQGASVAALRMLGRSEEADATARSSLALFQGERLWHEPPPFLAIWFRALLALPSTQPEASALMASYVERVLREALDSGSGLFTRGGLGSYDRTTTIDQAAIIQILAMRKKI